MKLLEDLRNLDRNNIGGWPRSVKVFFIAVLMAVILFAGWYVFISGKQDDLASAQAKEVQLKQEFSSKQAQVVNLAALKQQLDEMNDLLRQMLRQLPSKTEMPALLVDISQTALSAGLDTELFQPGAEHPKEFYAEQPIAIRLTGTYHQFGAFISGVASLPRVVILTMHDVSLHAARASGSANAPPPGGRLTMEGTVKTYRYLGDEETMAAPGKPAKHAKGGK
ncbi:MAG TPA: type 4a pilus biogenesis protein PilO [Rhodanobacteraceae bacterium]|nr:type 4a pilus biogenesis protein PilO [Rhodanobacteraceae bacterium]